jgi:signal transduction histidine kinase
MNRWSRGITDFDKDIRDQLNSLTRSSQDPQMQELVAKVRELTANYRDSLDPVVKPELRSANYDPAAQEAKLYLLAAQISEQSDKIRHLNEELEKVAKARREAIGKNIMWGRTVAMFLVPSIGIALGWWTANRLQRSVTQIQVTLHDPALSAPGELGTVLVNSNVQVRGDELSSIRQQIELIVDRLRRTSEELHATRQAVVRSERLAAIGGLAAGVAHELRNPLTSVKLLLQHAASRGGDAVVAEQRMGLILDEIERMEATIQGLLDFSRPARPQRQLHDLRETLQRALNLVEARAAKQQVVTDSSLGEQPLMISGDPQQLHQVFVNLLINAIEAMPRGGRLSLATADEPPPGCLAIEVRDTGGGIPAELLPRLFEPFATTKERGTGLGLAVSRRIIEEHGGTIDVRPQPPMGTVFIVTLPAAADVSLPAPAHTQPPALLVGT